VQGLLQLGDNFSLPKTNKKKMIIKFIKNIETNINKLPVPTQTFMRNKFISILNGLARSSYFLNEFEKQIIANRKVTNQYIKNNPNLLITRADKGNITVALDKDYY